MPNQQLPPHNREAEEAVIGSLLIDPDAYHEVADILDAEDFYQERMGQIYRAIGDLIAEEKPVDVVVLGEVLEGRKQGKTSDLIPFLSSTPTSINVRGYAEIVAATNARRRLLNAASKIATAAHDETKNVERIMGEAEAALFDVADRAMGEGLTPARGTFRDLLDHTERLYERGGEMIGIPTGFIDLDRVLEGLKDSELIVIAARPGMGKTSLSLAIALHATLEEKKRVAVFNMEMPRRQVAQRMASLESRVDLRRLRRGALQESEWTPFMGAIGRLSELDLYISDRSDLTPARLIAECRRLDVKQGLDLVIVDYLQLMLSDRQRDNRTHEVGEISRAAKKLAMTLDVPVIILSQLNRACEQRQNKRPKLSDLRDSGTIEQDADVVVFIYRDEYYNPDTTDSPNVAEIDIAKHRNGPTGRADLYWNGQLAEFRNLQRQSIDLNGRYNRNGQQPEVAL